MEYVQQFTQGLDGPASLTFMGLLFVALLIGLLPAGFIYGFRVRDLKRRLAKHVAAHQRVTQERGVLEGQLHRERERATELDQRLRRLGTDRAAQATELTRLRDGVSAAQSEALAAQIEARDRQEEVQALRNKVAGLQGKVQSLQQSARPQPAHTGFDLDLMASLKATKTKLAAMEARVEQLTGDNERLRRELTRPA